MVSFFRKASSGSLALGAAYLLISPVLFLSVTTGVCCFRLLQPFKSVEPVFFPPFYGLFFFPLGEVTQLLVFFGFPVMFFSILWV